MRAAPFFRRPPTTTAEAARKDTIGGTAIIVDVRGDREWQRGHIPGSVHIPLAELADRALELPEDRQLITFCTGGLLSSGAANILIELGFDAASMSRGLMGWRSNGGPLDMG
jgi:rhodanese-related sulfurtransferase